METSSESEEMTVTGCTETPAVPPKRPRSKSPPDKRKREKWKEAASERDEETSSGSPESPVVPPKRWRLKLPTENFQRFQQLLFNLINKLCPVKDEQVNDQLQNRPDKEKKRKERDKEKISYVFTHFCGKTDGYKKNLFYLENHSVQKSSFSPKRCNQFAFAFIEMNNGPPKIFPITFPDEKEHSEEILIRHINTFLEKNRTHAKSIGIYTENSPCLKRCLPKIILESYKWQKFGILTDVYFSSYWRKSYLKTIDVFRESLCTDLTSWSPDYYDRIEARPFKMEISLRTFKQENYFKPLYDALEKVNNKDRESKKKELISPKKKLLEELNNSPRKKREYTELINAKVNDIIANLELNMDHKVCTDIAESMIEKDFLTHLQETLAADLERAVVQFFQHLFQGNNYPLKLHQTNMIAELPVSKGNLKYSKFSKEESPFYRNFIECDKFSFPVDVSQLSKARLKDKEIRIDFNTLKTPSLTRKQHLDHGEKVIASSASDETLSEEILESWKEIVKLKFESLVKQNIAEDLYRALKNQLDLRGKHLYRLGASAPSPQQAIPPSWHHTSPAGGQRPECQDPRQGA
ncbi:uncharacterized protein LOC115404767 [Salarias fasciatus]|uniref:uncharacterized protein LOC115404767 n=1 Tax=Salarias fasciatus TaxID=181472 RepID=UPI00117684A0|nr:uncharacterized protein LOC115404767 [Salarias fasciatus]